MYFDNYILGLKYSKNTIIGVHGNNIVHNNVFTKYTMWATMTEEKSIPATGIKLGRLPYNVYGFRSGLF